MAKRKVIKILEQQVTAQGDIVTLPPNTVSVSITCMENSANNLLIGWDENASSKNYLSQGESRGYGPYLEGQYMGNRALRFAWLDVATGTVLTGSNQGLVIFSYEVEIDC